MKLIENILWSVVLIELILSSTAIATKTDTPIPEFIQPPRDKRYELFDFIATSINEWSAKQLIIEGSSYSNLLKPYNEFLASHPSETSMRSLQRLKQQIERFIAASQKLEKNPENCNLQTQALHELEELPKYLELLTNSSSSNLNTLLNIFRQRFNEANTNITQDFDKTLNEEFYHKLRTTIERFQMSLDGREKETFKDLLKCCNEFLLASDGKKKYQVFERLIKIILQERLPRDDGNNSNCKWESAKFAEFTQKIYSWSLANSQRK